MTDFSFTPLRILDENFDVVDIIDSYISFIWTERYASAGDFELVFDIENASYRHYFMNYSSPIFLEAPWSSNLMIPEDYTIKTNEETGDQIIVQGRSLESLLTYRVINPATVYWKSPNNFIPVVIRHMVNDTLIAPSDTRRKYPGFIIGDFDVFGVVDTVSGSFENQELYEVIKGLCDSIDLGFKINYIPESRNISFSLYTGTDRSGMPGVSPVIFSENFDNLVSSESKESERQVRTDLWVEGDKAGDETVPPMVHMLNSAAGFKRKEIYYKPTNIQRQAGDVVIDLDTYKSMLFEEGLREWERRKRRPEFTAEIDPNHGFQYGTDFFLGDIVRVITPYMQTAGIKCRVAEVIYSCDAAKTTMIPKLVQYLE